MELRESHQTPAQGLPTEPPGGERCPVVALTGASRGIGLATARALATAGYAVVAGARTPAAIDAAGLGARVRAVRLDLTDGASIERFAAVVREAAAHTEDGSAEGGVGGAASAAAGRAGGGAGDGGALGNAGVGGDDHATGGAAGSLAGEPTGGAANGTAGGRTRGVADGTAGGVGGGLAALINNAGVGALGAAEEFPLERARGVFETNLWGAARLAQLLLPLLRAGATPRQPTCLVNVGSLIAEYPVPFHAYYAASKSALRGYTLALRGELAGHGVAVVLVEPGDIATGTTPLRNAVRGSPYAAAFERVTAARAAKMAAAPRPEEVARRVLRVLGQRRPPPIIACGGSAPLLRLARRLLPDRLAQALTLRAYRLGRTAGRPRTSSE